MYNIFMEIQIAASKIDKFNSPDSGDTIEVVERPNGGISVVLASGLSDGKSAKMVSYSVVKKVISLIADGVRDGAAARAASDALFTQYNGKSISSLNILSADLQTDTLVLSCNSPTPIFLCRDDIIEKLSIESTLLGTGLDVKPSVSEIPIEPQITVVAPSSGMLKAGIENGQVFDFYTALSANLEEQQPTSSSIADSLLNQAISMDQGQPNEDMSVVVLRVFPGTRNRIRKINVNIPFAEFE
jgi:serine phosphatase RsbU (regulator of sigma subunit)